MELWEILLIVFAAALLFIAAVSCICFFRIFYSFRTKPKEEYPIPDGKIYEPFREQMIAWIKQTRGAPHEDVFITSYDGLRLTGKYFECKKGAPIEILFHGYRGTAERDLSGGVDRCFSIGHNALIVDQRGSGGSEGRVITFGSKERLDCLKWIEFVICNIDRDARIILTGISMGAATVMSASGERLPENVIGILADCGYTSTRDIIKKVIRDMKLPAGLLYPFARLGAIVFGGFDPNKNSPIEAMGKCTLPIIFFHGDTDDFVPHYMSEANFNACVSKNKKFVTIKGAGHGLCFPKDTEMYLKELKEFFAPFTAEERI